MNSAVDTPDTTFDLPGLWPTREQHLVLTAALCERDRALEAFDQWVATLNIAQTFDREVYRLLPLLYDNMRRHGCKDPLLKRLKGVYRISWVQTQKLFAHMEPVVQKLSDAGLEITMLKGAPLGVVYYRNPTLRPLMDLDILVPQYDAMRATDLLVESGFKPFVALTQDILRFRHAMQFSGPNGEELDLHWRSLAELADNRLDNEFRLGVAAVEMWGRQLLIPDPTRMLLHTVIHGVRWNPEPPVRWMADAVSILRSNGDEIAWDEMVDFAQRSRLTYRLGLGLRYLSDHYVDSIPSHVHKKLQGQRQSWIERVEAKTILRDEREIYQGTLGPVLVPAGEYVRFAATVDPISAIYTFAGFLRFYWGLRQRREIIFRILGGMRSRLRRWLHAG